MTRVGVLLRMLPVVILLACGSHEEPNWVTTDLALDPACPVDAAGGIRDSAGIRIVEHQLKVDSVRENSPSYPAEVIRIDGLPGKPFGMASSAAELASGDILVSDSQTAEVFRFDAMGTNGVRIGMKGEGPGDYNRITGIQRITSDTVAVIDRAGYRISFLKADGRFARMVRLDPSHPVPADGNFAAATERYSAGWSSFLGRFDDGRYLGLVDKQPMFKEQDGPPGTYRTRETGSWLIHFSGIGEAEATLDESVRRRAIIYDHEGAEIGGISFYPLLFSPILSATVFGQGYLLSRGARHEIERRAQNGSLTELIRVCRPAIAVSDSSLARARAFAISTRQVPSDGEGLLRGAPVWPVHPGWTRLMIAPGGNIWAAEFAIAADPVTWWVFDSIGVVRGTFTLPARRHLLTIGKDRLFIRAQDEFDIRWIEVVPLPATLR